MQSSDQSSDSPSIIAFERRVASLQAWAAISASRSRDLQYEWPALGFAFAAYYLAFVDFDADRLTLIDLVVLVATIGTGIALSVFESRARQVLLELARGLETVGPDDPETSRWRNVP